jgi:hypothetical protein
MLLSVLIYILPNYMYRSKGHVSYFKGNPKEYFEFPLFTYILNCGGFLFIYDCYCMEPLVPQKFISALS